MLASAEWKPADVLYHLRGRNISLLPAVRFHCHGKARSLAQRHLARPQQTLHNVERVSNWSVDDQGS